MTVRYELQVHSRDVLTSSEYDKHTGYDLIKYVDDMPIQIQSIDLYNYNGQIKYDIRTQVVAQDLYESTGEIVGSFMFYDGVPVAVTAEWLAEMQYCVSEPLLINGSAVQAFNKIKLEATILNQLTNDLNYNIVWRNCNTSTNYFAQQYVNGQNVFATLPVGEYIGSSFSFYDPNSTSTTDITIKAVRNIIDKYYSLVGTNVDLSNVNYGVVNQSDALYAKFTTDDYNYVFAGNGEANIVDIYGDSFIYADAGNHTINAGNGNDVIYGREANVIDGGDGNDIIYAGDQTYAAHSIGAGTGDDYIYAGHGGDDVRGGNGNNTVYLGSGSDKYIGGDDVDIVDGGSQDFIFTDSVDSSFKYNLSADLSGDINTIHLGGGADEYKGGTGADIVYGGEDNDIIRGGDGENKLYGENGDDILIGGAGNDYLVGGNGNDIIYGYGGNNELNGDAGNDYIYGGDNADTIHGGDGDDYIRGYNGDNWLYGDAGNDNIYGQSDNDNLYGGTGADYLSPGTGNNFIDCGADNHMDMVRINNGANGVDTIVNATGSDYILCSGGFNMSSMEQVGNDIIIYGNRGNKIIIKDIKLPEEEELEDPENPGTPSSIPFENVPLLYQPDGTVLKWNGTEYVDSGTELPPYNDVMDYGDIPDGGNIPTEGDISEGGTLPGEEYGETIEKIFEKIKEAKDSNSSADFTTPENGTSKSLADTEINIPQNLIEDISTFWASAEVAKSPLVLDLDNDGIETVSTDGGVYFDHDNNQKYENTGWIGKNEAFLVRDLNNNGQIDNGSEMFGNHTLKSDGTTAYNGFEALADLDSNNNGKFDSGDDAWNEVKVWRDYNTNGTVENGELLTLEQAGVESINLKYNYQTETDSNGNMEIQQGTYTKTDGTTGKISDVWFAVNGANTKFEENAQIPDDVAILPNIRGFGNVASLHTAMALDESGALKTLVQQYMASTDETQKDAILDNIIYHWTGVQDLPTDGRDPTQIYGKVIDDTRKLEALEEFLGEEFLGTWCWGERDPNPHGQAAPHILQAYNTLKNFVGMVLSADIKNNSYLQNIILTYDSSLAKWDIDVSGAVALLQDAYNESVDYGRSELLTLSALLQNFDNVKDIYAAFKAYGIEEGTEFQQDLLSFGNNTVGSSGNDNLTGTDDNDLIDGAAGNDTIKGGAGNDVLMGGEGNDSLYGQDGNDTLEGGAGNDYLYGDNGNDILIGGAGSDILTGGEGSDIYQFDKGFGNDSIDNLQNSSDTNTDVIQFGDGISAANTVLERQGFDLIIRVKYPNEGLSDDTVRVYSYFDKQGTSSATVSAIVFADGTSWDYDYVLTHWNSVPDAGGGQTVEGTDGKDSLNGTNNNDIIIGHDGDDTIRANSGNDKIDAGKGNDMIYGGDGNDTYFWNWGDGADTINDSNNRDNISFGEGIIFDDLTFRNSGNDLVIVIKNNESQKITIQNFFYNANYKIESLNFYDGSSVALSEIGLTLKQLETGESIKGTEFDDVIHANGGDDSVSAGYGNDVIYGGSGQDTISGQDGDDIIYGENGNDTLYGNNGNDIISGGQGFDTLYGNDGNDTLIGGAGSDRLEGGKGDDVYIYNLGDGLDTIYDDGPSTDILRFGEGISYDDLTFQRDSNNLIIYLFNDITQGVIISNFFTSQSWIEYLEFADGSVYYLNTMGLTFKQSNGHDSVSGTSYADTIYGNGGNDSIYGNNGDDIITGGKGDDRLEGGYGNDTYIYNLGDGFDTIDDYEGSSTEGRSDKIKFGEGISLEDLSFSREGSDLKILINNDPNQGILIERYYDNDYYKIETLEFADGSTVQTNTLAVVVDKSQALSGQTINATGYNDTLTGSIYADTINGGNGNDTIIGNDGNDTLNGGYGNDTINGGLGDDKIYGDNGDDIITGGKGDDRLEGGYGNDTYIYNLGDGFDTIDDYEGSSTEGRSDKIKFGEGISLEDLSFSREGSDLKILINNDPNQGILIERYYDNDYYKIETLEFADGSTVQTNTLAVVVDKSQALSGQTIDATRHNDTLTGSIYADTINGGDGDDIISGNDGNDTLNGGNGNDTINGGLGDDKIYGNNGDDIITGGKGDDRLEGGYGNDTYIYNLGDGFDTIDDYEGSSTEGRSDKIKFGEGISLEDLSFSREGSDLKILINNDPNQGILIERYYDNDYYKIETLEFADGSTVQTNTLAVVVDKSQVLSGQTINATGYNDTLTGSIYADTINGGNGNDTIIGNDGNDTLNGGNGNDTINGGLGDDKIYGDNGDDIITGGKGDDRLEGGYGNDTYIYNLGDGFDTIYDYESSSTKGRSDKIKFGEGISLEDLSFSREGYNLRILINNDPNQGILIERYYDSDYYKIETLEFADGSTVQTNTLAVVVDKSQALSGQTIDATRHNDTLTGSIYADTINGGDGDDIISGNDGNDTLNGGNGNDTINGGLGDDKIYGNNGDDIITGGKGDDRLEGGYGNDTYIYNLGDGFDTIDDYEGSSTEGRSDKIKFGEGISLEDLSFSREGSDLKILINNDPNQGILIERYYDNDYYKIETLEFADGSTVQTNTLAVVVDKSQVLSGQTINATGYNDTLTGSIYADMINGGNGNDTIIGNDGNDTLNGGYGNDTYIWNKGNGFDTITDYGLDADNIKTDKIKFGEGITFEDLSFVRQGNNMHIYVNNDKNEGVCINDFFQKSSNLYYYQINKLEFADGTIKDISNINYTYGETFNNDNISGTSESDTYHYEISSGLDTIADTNGTDKIKFGTGISLNNISFDKSGNDLHIIVNGDYTQGIIVKDFYRSTSYRIENLEFADGSSFTLSNENITLLGINQTLSGTSDDDILVGGNGNDVISAGDGYNDITGGKGNDTLNGGYDNDYYYYNLGDGYDLISDTGGRDQIIFGENISSEDISFRRINDNLQIIIDHDLKQGIEIINFFVDSNKIEKLVYADGSSFNLTRGLTLETESQGGNIVGTSESDILLGDDYDNVLTGNAGDDTLVGGKGHDNLNGGAGNDIYQWSIGHDFDTITDTSGENILEFGSSINYTDLTFERHDADLVIKYNDEDYQGIRIVNFFNEAPIKSLRFNDSSEYELIANQLPLSYDNTSATITGHNGNNTINATDRDNTITTYGGDDIINAGGGDDNISAGHGDDTITGSTGNDSINGDYGNDTYIWNLGDGFDTITDSQGVDKLIFGENIEFNDLYFRKEGNDLLINVNDNRHQGMRLKNFYSVTNNDYPVDILQFNDGTQFNLTKDTISLIYSDESEIIDATIYDDVINAKAGNDTINTYDGDDIIYAGTGNDTVNAGNGDDVLYGQEGNDILNGNSGDDTLIGGTGNDTLNGGTGKDTYIWNLGDGFDTITDNDGVDKIVFGENITFDNLVFRKEGTGLLINVNNERFQGILINRYFEDGYNIEKMEFADGSVIDLTQTKFELVSDTIDTDITGTMYDDVLTGNIKNNNITAGNGDDLITGGAGDDTILAEEGNDIITGGLGNDSLNGGYGNDTYIWNLGDGLDTITDAQGIDKIIFGENISFTDLSFIQQGNNLYINVKNTLMQGIVITDYFNNSERRIETLQFADNSIIDLSSSALSLKGSGTINGTDYNDTLTGSNEKDTIYGGSGNDVIYGAAGQDYIEGGNGNDIIYGGTDNDTLLGGLGNDTYVWHLGDGLDTITDSEGDNRILFGSDITISNLAFEMHGNDLHILINNDQSQGLIIKNYLTSDLNKIEYLEFANGTELYLPDLEMIFNYGSGQDTINGTYNNDIIDAGAGNDTVYGNDGDDTITGGLDNDILYGGNGRDTYIYSMGDGCDIINETRGNDTLLLKNIAKDDLSFRQDGKNLIITIANNETITINNFYQDANSKVETIKFANNEYPSIDIAGSGLTLEQTNANDTVNTTSYDDTIYGNGGHDTINAGAGNDILIGGIGNDILNGGSGNDTYVYSLGDGFDTITDTEGSDKIKFGEGISVGDLSFEQIGKNLRIYINGKDSEGILINNHFDNVDNQVESIEFSNGSTLDITSADQLIQSMNAFGVSSASLTDLSDPSANVNQMYDLASSYDLTKK